MITTEEVKQAIDALASMTTVASITPETVAAVLEKLRQLSDAEAVFVKKVAEEYIQKIIEEGESYQVQIDELKQGVGGSVSTIDYKEENTNKDKVYVQVIANDGDDGGSFFLPSATEEKAGVMSADDKRDLKQHGEKLSELESKTNFLNGVFCKDVTFASGSVLFNKEQIPAGKTVTIVGSADRNVYVGVYTDEDAVIVNLGPFKGENIEVEYLLPDNYSYLNVKYGELSHTSVTFETDADENKKAIVEESERAISAETEIVNTLNLVTENISEKMFDVVRSSSNEIPCILSVGNKILVKLSSVNNITGTIEIRSLKNGEVVQSFYKNTSFTTIPNEEYYWTFDVESDADAFVIQHVGNNNLHISVFNINEIIKDDIKKLYTKCDDFDAKVCVLRSLKAYKNIENPKVGDIYYSEYYSNFRKVTNTETAPSSDIVLPELEGALYRYNGKLYYRENGQFALFEDNDSYVKKEEVLKMEAQDNVQTDKYFYLTMPMTLKKDKIYRIVLKKEDPVTAEIKIGTGKKSGLMIDVIDSSATINSVGYSFDYTPTVDGVGILYIGKVGEETFSINIYSIEYSTQKEKVENIEKAVDTKPVRFILITDMHYRPFEISTKSYNGDDHAPYASDEDTRWDGLTQNERTQKWINEIKKECQDGSIDFVLSTGDTLQGDDDSNKIGLKLFRDRFLSQLNVPFFSCVGNHDMKYSDEQYMETFYHHREFSFECGNLYVICPDFCSQRLKDNGAWYPDPLEDHLAWMNAEVKKAKDRNMIIAVASHMSQGTETHNGVTVNYAEKLYDWMEANDIHIYLVGHQHGYEAKLINGRNNIYRLCSGWYANRDPYYYKHYTNGWGYDIVEFKNGTFSHTHVVPEWNYRNTQDKLRELGESTEIGDNGYVAESRVTEVILPISCKNKNGAMYDAAYMSNMAAYDDAIVEVPEMIPVS